MIKGILIGFAFLSLATQANAQTICSKSYLSTTPGDVVRFWESGTGSEVSGVINGVWWWNYPGAFSIGGAGNNRFDGFEFVATGFDTTVEYDLLGVNRGGCSTIATVVGHVDLGFVQIALSPEAKAEAQWWSDGFRNTAIFCGGAALYMKYIDPRWFAIFSTCTAAAKIGKEMADIYVKDPWDPDYQTPYDAPWQDLGFDCSGDGQGWCYDMADHATRIAQMMDGAKVSVDRANSAASAGDRNSYGMQLSYLKWYLGAAGDEMPSLGYDYWMIAYIMESEGGDPSTVEAIRQTAEFYDAMGDSMRGMR